MEKEDSGPFPSMADIEAEARALRAKIEGFPWWPGGKPELRAELLEADVERYWRVMMA